MSLIRVISAITTGRGSGTSGPPIDPPIVDTTPPAVFSIAAINATTIRVTFTESTTPTAAGWTFNNGTNKTPSSVALASGNTWDFAVTGLAYGQTITASYNSTTGNTKDVAGNELVTFGGIAVTNSIAAPAPTGTPGIWIVCGQSNCGRSRFSELDATNQLIWGGAMTKAYILNPYVNSSSYAALNPGTNTMLMNQANLDEFGFEMSFAKAAVNDSGQNQYILKFAYGSTSLYDNWKSPNGTYHAALRTHIATAIAQAKAVDPTAFIKGFLWMQGENDTTSQVFADAYLTNLQTFFSDLRTYIATIDSNSANFRTIIGEVRDYGGLYPQIRQAQFDYCSISGNNAVLIDTDDLGLRDSIHWSSISQITLGQRMYANKGAIYVPSNTSALSFTAIPFSDPDLRRPGAGLEYWIYQSSVKVPSASSPVENEMDRYDRFEWRSFENGAQGSYNFTEFDDSIQIAIDRGQKFSFAIMSYCDSCTDFSTTVGGATLTSYPAYLHTAMQAESINSRDWIDPNTNCWVPNWNSLNYLNRYRDLLNAVAAHIAGTTYSGVPYSKVIRYIDVRGMGNYNEWHHYPYLNDIPAGRFPTIATYKRIIDDYIAAFPNFQLVALCDGYDPEGWSSTPPEVISYLLTVSNNKGLLGYRRDNIGSGWGTSSDYWLASKLENNPAQYNGVDLKNLIMARWQSAPLVGEVMNGQSANSGSGLYWDLVRQVTDYHINSMGNGNLESPTSGTTINAVRLAAKTMGYRLKINSGTITSSIVRGTPFNLSLTWANEGVSPTYEDWRIDFELRNGATVLWTGSSAFNPRLFLPGTPQIISDTLTIGTGISAGTYNLHMIVRDPNSYRGAMPLFITGVQGDGSYILKSNIVIS